jgi:hypothetical protein
MTASFTVLHLTETNLFHVQILHLFQGVLVLAIRQCRLDCIDEHRRKSISAIVLLSG